MPFLINRGIWYLIMFSKIFAQDSVANLPQGRVMGIKAYVGASLTPVEIYYGIPYAIAPKGRYRFSAPERHGGWRGTFFAHRIPPHCPHAGDTDKDHFSEDCLFLNVWTPRHSEGKSLPVTVILYSESWVKGGVSLPCQELAAEGVVVVTVMYRLNLLAFFTLRSISARGNLALLDQYLALLWIRENIPAFSGDPTAITLLGHSAGADSVLHLIASPRTLGLFQRAIIMSPFDIWNAINEQRVSQASEVERISREIAHSLGCNNDTDQEILQCMRGQALSDMLPLYTNVSWNKWFHPIPDNFLPESEQFLPNSLSAGFSSTILHKQIEILLGTNDLEAINGIDGKYEDIIKQGTSFVSEYVNTVVIPESLKHFSLDRSEILPVMVQAVRWEYWSDKPRRDIGVYDFAEFAGRVESSAKWGAGVALVAAKLAGRVGRVYVYRYSQPAGVDLRGRQHNYTGAVHGSDLISLLGDLFTSQVARRPATLQEKRISALLRKYIVNFIKFGSPGEEDTWRRYRSGDAHIFDIREKVSDKLHYHNADRDVKFWLEYLPALASLLNNAERTEQLTGTTGESRLRGGVFAMCGVASVLLLLLCICVILLHRQLLSRSFSVTTDDVLNK